MKNKSSRFLILFLILIALNACSTFQPERSLVQKRIDSLLVSDFFKTSQAAISVYDLSKNNHIFNINEKLLLRPASNQKLLTTSAALLFLGTDYNFSTSVYYTGEIKDSICNGNLFVVGGFDPEFSLNDLDSLSKEIKKFGIKKINGNLYGDVSAMDSLYWGKGWMWDDDPGAYIPYLSPLSINKNCIKIIYQPSDLNKPSTISFSPSNNFVKLNNLSITLENGKSSFNITRDWMNKKNTITASGNFPISSKKDSVSLNIFRPEFYFLNLMKESLAKNGVLLNGEIDTLSLPINPKKVFSITHGIVPAVINANKKSDNLNAELLLRTLAYDKLGKFASAEKGKIFVDSLITLAGSNRKNYNIVDGSGLSFYDLVSAELLVNVLKYVYKKDSDVKDIFFQSLPIAGVDGTLSNRFTNSAAKKHVLAKTGTLRGVSTLSGYIQTKNNTTLAFSILIQNFAGGSAKAKEFQEKICEILYQEL